MARVAFPNHHKEQLDAVLSFSFYSLTAKLGHLKTRRPDSNKSVVATEVPPVPLLHHGWNHEGKAIALPLNPRMKKSVAMPWQEYL